MESLRPFEDHENTNKHKFIIKNKLVKNVKKL